MIQQGTDWGFVGEAYEAPMLLQDAQRCINWYCEVSENKTNGSKMPIALLGAPGLQSINSATGTGTFGGPIQFATGDGTTTIFNTFDSNLNLEQVFMNNWQGNQLQYTTPRTNVAKNNVTSTGFGSSGLVALNDFTGGPDGGPSVYGLESVSTQVYGIRTVASDSIVSIGDFYTFVIDMHLTPGYTNNENVIAISFNNMGLIGGVTPNAVINIANNTVTSSSSGVTAYFVGALPNGFSRFSFIVGAASTNSAFGPYVLIQLNNGSSFTGDAKTRLYVRPDIKKTQTVSSWIENTGSTAKTIVDYSVNGTNTVFSIAPTNGAILTKQTYSSSPNAAAIRGMWTLPGGVSSIVIVGNIAYILTVSVPATQTTQASFSLIQIGTLNTYTGPVSIRDNGVVFGGKGGFAVIVDGTYGYYYNLTGLQTTVSFTGGVSNTQSTISVSTIPNGIVAGAGVTISDTSGFIPANTLFTGVSFNALTLSMSKPATGTNASDTITITIPAFGQITDTAFLPASMVAFIEGWLIFSEPKTRTFFTTAATPYTLLFAGSFYALKDSSTDNLVTLYENNRELWLIGERTSEVWYDSGNPNFAFSRIPSIGPQIGCAAYASIARLGPNLVWLARNEQGQNIVVMQNNYDWQRISTHAIDHAISSYSVVSDAIGFCYEEEGHWFYVLTFPTGDATWVYDAQTAMWHQRGSWDQVNGVYHRMRANAFCNIANMNVVGDYQNGSIYQMSRKFYSDAGNPLRCQRRAPHLWEKQNRKRLFHSWLQVEFTPGVGVSTGQGSDPQAMLRWYDYNKNLNWSNEHWVTIGATGAVGNRAIWKRLGSSRDRIYELNFTDPVPRDIIGVTLFFEPEEEAEAQLARTG